MSLKGVRLYLMLRGKYQPYPQLASVHQGRKTYRSIPPFVIITDGFEKASHKYDSSAVKKMVKGSRSRDGNFFFWGRVLMPLKLQKDLE